MKILEGRKLYIEHYKLILIVLRIRNHYQNDTYSSLHRPLPGWDGLSEHGVKNSNPNNTDDHIG